MGAKKALKVSLGTTICLIIIVLLIVALGAVYYLGFVKNNKEVTQLSIEKQNLQKQVATLEENKKISETETENLNNNMTMTKEEATKIVQDIYSKAYDIIQEGNGLTNSNTVNITAGQEGTVGGVINVSAYKLDFSKIETYFTERAINYVKTEFTDTPYGHKDGNYYIYSSENKYSYTDKKEFLTTIFGVTDQSKRTFDAKLYDDNMIVAVSPKSSFFELDEYIILKKVNNTWKIDMFESL